MTLEERIRERAHRIWEEEGRPVGRDHDHWERARREIEAASAHPVAEPAPRRAGARPSTGSSSPAGKSSGGRQTGASGLVGSDDTGGGLPDAMGAEDLNVDRTSDPRDSRPTTGRSKLAGS